MRIIETVFLDERDAGTVRPVQAQLRRRTGVAEAVHVELAVVREIGHVPAGFPADAARLEIARQRHLVNVALHRTVERAGDEDPLACFIDVQKGGAGAGAVGNVPVAGRERADQLAVVVVKV